MKSKPTLVRKNQNLKPAIHRSTANYNDYHDQAVRGFRGEDMSSESTSKLVDDCNQLEVEEHKQIYSFLRDHNVPAEFFSPGRGTINFDLDKLSNELKWELQRYIAMTMEHLNRSKQLDKLENENQAQFNHLAEQLNHPQSSNLSPLEVASGNGSGNGNGSEEAKYQRMLKLQFS